MNFGHYQSNSLNLIILDKSFHFLTNVYLSYVCVVINILELNFMYSLIYQTGELKLSRSFSLSVFFFH